MDLKRTFQQFKLTKKSKRVLTQLFLFVSVLLFLWLFYIAETANDIIGLIALGIAFVAFVATIVYSSQSSEYAVSSLHFDAADFLKAQLQALDSIELIDMNEKLDEAALQIIDQVFEKRYDLITRDRRVVEEIKKMSRSEETDAQKINESLQHLLTRKNNIEKEYDALIATIKKEMKLS